ncbi:MAG: hypothetical protein ABIG92_03510 [Candidatus Omnitrophota bacterium]
MNKKAVALFSGGLDSMLAIKLMLKEGIEVHALNFLTVFCTCTKKGCMHQATKASRELGVPLKIMNITKEYMDVVRSPKFGRGKGMNPCIDCRIFTFKKAKTFMDEINASFIVTGEVLGQRPMSQRRQAIELIEKESGLRGLIVRPLSAKYFDETLPEKNGLIKRENLLDIEGRSRQKQMELAKEFHINDYPCPAGGCLLTEVGFSKKVKDLFQYIPDYKISDIHLLKVGRQFRIHEGLKLFVGRDQRENELLVSFTEEGDHILDVIDMPSPIAIARGKAAKKDLLLAASILARYSDAKEANIKVSYKIFPSEYQESLIVSPAAEDTLSTIRL